MSDRITAPGEEKGHTPCYAGVRVLDNPLSIDETYHYYIPPTMVGTMARGAFVTVPFGRGNRKQLALVTAIGERDILPSTIDPTRIKPLWGVCRGDLSLSEEQILLCEHVVETTLCTMGEAVRAVVPAAALASLTETYRHLADAEVPSSAKASLSTGDLMMLTYLQKQGQVSARAARTRFGGDAADTLEKLCRLGLAERELSLCQPAVPTVRVCVLSRSVEETEAILRGEDKSIPLRSAQQHSLLSALVDAGGRATPADLHRAAGMATASGGISSPLKALAEKKLLTVIEEERPLATTDTTPPPLREAQTLSPEQVKAVATLTALAKTGEPRAALLHGVTGSGKTRVILEMVDRMLDSGRGSIILLPEIGLTPQMLNIFRGRYGARVAVIHSGLSAGEKLDSYRRIRAGEAPVVVGTRSAVFAPVRNLGLIVLDEEQEHTYKSDMDPKYHARDIARFRCAQSSALLLLSSATPSPESYYKATTGVYTLVTMKERYGGAHLPEVRLVDMRGEPDSGNVTPLGMALNTELEDTLARGEQAVLFLNRRGYSHQLQCRSCGQAISCPHCSVAMHSHKLRRPRREADGTEVRDELVCHWCGTRRAYPVSCPSCDSPHLHRMGYGTQRVEEDLSTLFPSARVMRMDADTTTTRSAYEDLVGSFRRREADILLGTQMVTKGHDFPDVTLVGVLSADQSLYLDDYRAGERTFSMVTQAIGRAGRAEKPGLAIIQTMNPENDILRLAAAQDYVSFYEREIRLRRALQFPPFCDIVLLTLTSGNENALSHAATRLSDTLLSLQGESYADVPIVAFGPFEAPVYRVDNVYRLRMVIKCRLTRRSREMWRELMRRFMRSDASRGAHAPTLSIDFNPSSI